MRSDGRNPRNVSSDEQSLDERVIFVNRVARVVKGGRRFRFQALVVVGDHKGSVGMGVSKGADVTAAINKATEVAKRNIIKLPIYHGTLTHDVEAKVGGAKILILPASAGTGLIAGGVVRSILEVAGFENALSKSLGSNNRINVAYATLVALQSMVPSNKWITTLRSKPKAASAQENKRGTKK